MSRHVATGIVIADNGIPHFNLARVRAALTKARGSINVAEQILLAAAIEADTPERANVRDVVPEPVEEPQPGFARRVFGWG